LANSKVNSDIFFPEREGTIRMGWRGKMIKDYLTRDTVPQHRIGGKSDLKQCSPFPFITRELSSFTKPMEKVKFLNTSSMKV
jgi:hypothetical protein